VRDRFDDEQIALPEPPQKEVNVKPPAASMALWRSPSRSRSCTHASLCTGAREEPARLGSVDDLVSLQRLPLAAAHAEQLTVHVVFVLAELGCAAMDISAARSAELLVSSNAAISCCYNRLPEHNGRR
jgi:hypothetical protein